MWILLIIIMSSATPIESYPSLGECELERIRITGEMDNAYPPAERDTYKLECVNVKVLQKKKDAI